MSGRKRERVDGIAISRIGVITEYPGIIHLHEKNRDWELRPQGFSHFDNQRL